MNAMDNSLLDDGSFGLGVVIAATLICAAAVFAVGYCLGKRQKKPVAPALHNSMELHWDPSIERRGLGQLITKVNHIALIVGDVGRSLAFYTEVLGFQQIQRPNFDRHGAWLTIGNVELHLIKGVPTAPSGTDLIVSHIAIETEFPDIVLEKLLEMNVAFRQNVSVPEPNKARNNMQEDFDSSDGKVMQYFIRDPDGYYWELCNCDVLTKFVLQKEDTKEQFKRGHFFEALLGTYAEGSATPTPLRFPLLAKVSAQTMKHVTRARKNLSTPWDERVKIAFDGVKPAEKVDPDKLARLIRRQKTYCDITQGFSEIDIEKALKASGNDVPKAILLLSSFRRDVRVWLPPQYFVNDGGKDAFKGKVVQHVHKTNAPSALNLGTTTMYDGAQFHDNDADKLGVAQWKSMGYLPDPKPAAEKDTPTRFSVLLGRVGFRTSSASGQIGMSPRSSTGLSTPQRRTLRSSLALPPRSSTGLNTPQRRTLRSSVALRQSFKMNVDAAEDNQQDEGTEPLSNAFLELEHRVAMRRTRRDDMMPTMSE